MKRRKLLEQKKERKKERLDDGEKEITRKKEKINKERNK